MANPLRIVLCGKTPQIATAVKAGLQPECEGQSSSVNSTSKCAPNWPLFSHPCHTLNFSGCLRPSQITRRADTLESGPRQHRNEKLFASTSSSCAWWGLWRWGGEYDQEGLWKLQHWWKGSSVVEAGLKYSCSAFGVSTLFNLHRKSHIAGSLTSREPRTN